MYIFSLPVQYRFEYIRTVVLSIFERWYSVSWITVCCLYLSWIIIIVYTESALSITWKQAPTNKERIKCEKNQLNNSFCVNTWWTCTIFACRQRYYPWRSKGYMFRAFVILNVFFYILNLEYRKKLETTFLLIQKLFLRTSVSVKCYPKCK